MLLYATVSKILDDWYCTTSDTVLSCGCTQIAQHIQLAKARPDLSEGSRSPSPPPQYDENGVRTNTRAQRAVEKLTVQAQVRGFDLSASNSASSCLACYCAKGTDCALQDIVTEITRKQPGYRPPPDLRLAKRQRKIFVPVREYPHYNFIGLIIGPRGNTQKRMQQESGAKIALRGRGSVKDGRGARAGLADPADNEDLHVMITADTEDSLNKVLAWPASRQICETRASAIRTLVLRPSTADSSTAAGVQLTQWWCAGS